MDGDREFTVKEGVFLWILGAFILGIVEGVFCFLTFDVLPLAMVTSGIMAYVLFAGAAGTIVSVLFSGHGSGNIRRIDDVLSLFTSILVVCDTAVIFRTTPYLRMKVGQGWGLLAVSLVAGAVVFMCMRLISSRTRRPVAFFLSSVISLQLSFLFIRFINQYTHYETIFYVPPAVYYNLMVVVLFLPFLYIAYRFFRFRTIMKFVSTISNGTGTSALLALSLGIFLFGKFYRPAPEPVSTRPNILLIIMDTTRSDHLFCYGYHRETSPNIDRLAAEGVLFEEAIATAPWTLPTHASMLTGLYPETHGAHWEHMYLDGSLSTAAELLGEHGYQTVGFSNNGIVSRATNIAQGFDSFYEMWRGAYRFPTLFSQIGDIVYRMAGRDDAGSRLTNDMIRGWFQRSYDPARPFFMLINYLEPHLNYDPPVQFRRRFVEDSEVVERMREMKIQTHFRLLASPSPKGLGLTDEEIEVLNALYDAEIAYLDSRIGELFGYLAEAGYRAGTFTILTSDHGENIGEHGLIDHQLNVYETLLNIPLIIWYPPRIDGGTRIEEMVQSVDLFPTVLEIAGVDTTNMEYPIQGKSLLDIVSGREGRDHTISEYMSPKDQFRRLEQWTKSHGEVAGFLRFDRRLKTIRTDSLKFIWASDGDNELYDLEHDPAETLNILDQRSTAADSLDRELENWKNSLPDIIGEKGDIPEMDEETRQLLKALGYID